MTAAYPAFENVETFTEKFVIKEVSSWRGDHIYDVKVKEPSAIVYAKNLVRGCELLCEMMSEFADLK